MLNDYIEDHEFLYRRVILNPNFWDFEKNKPTSAIFKDSNGASVDRQHDRNDEDVIKSFKTLPIRAIVKILTSTCRELNTFPVYKYLPDNIYHCEIHDSKIKAQMSSSKAKNLRDNSEIIYQISEE